MIELDSPLWLLALLALPLLLLGWRHRRRSLLALRIVSFLLLVLAFTQPQWVQVSPGGTILYLVDISRSAQAALSLEDLPQGDGVSNRLIPFGGPHDTDLGRALSGAAASLSEGGGKVVLISDGQDTAGRLDEGITALVGKRVPVDVVGTAPLLSDASLLLSAPTYVAVGERFSLIARIQSQGVPAAQLSLRADGKEVHQERLVLQEGENLFNFSFALSEPGIHTLEGRITAPEDTLKENDEASAYPSVLAPRGMLVVSSQPNGEAFTRLVNDQGLPAVLAKPSDLPADFLSLSAYEGIALIDVSRTELQTPQVAALSSFVQVLGGGLLVVGGGHSFTLGGYFRSDLEELLPVVSKPRLEEDLPEMAVVFVIDNSSSMWNLTSEVKKLDLAQEVAIRAAAPLRAKDQVGVLIFSDAAQWLLPLGTGRDFSAIKEKILTEGPGGGTNAYLALREAYRQLAASSAPLKHVIFVSDGKTREGDFPALVEEGRRQGIFTTALAVGADADLPFMEKLAQLGEGKYAAVSSPDQIPTVLYPPNEERPEKPLAEGPAALRLLAPTSNLSEFTPPDLDGYLKTQLKPKAEVIYQATPREEPVLASWMQGSGRVAVWLSDFSGSWTASWEAWPQQAAFWTALWRWVAPASNELATSLQVVGESLQIEVASSSSTPPTILLEGPDGQSLRAQAERTSPSRYQARAMLWGRGAYTLNVSQGERQSLFAVWLPEQELIGVGIDWGTLGRIAQETGGQWQDGIGENLIRNLPLSPRKNAMTPWFLVACMLLFLMEIALRRFQGAARRTIEEEGGGVDTG